MNRDVRIIEMRHKDRQIWAFLVFWLVPTFHPCVFFKNRRTAHVLDVRKSTREVSANISAFLAFLQTAPSPRSRRSLCPKVFPRTNFHRFALFWSTCFYSVSELEDKKAGRKEGGGGWTAYFSDANCMLVCGCLTCVALIIAERGVAFDSGVTLTARRLAEASWMTEDQRRRAGKQKSSWEKIRRSTTSTGAIVKVRINFSFLSFSLVKTSPSEFPIAHLKVCGVLSGFVKTNGREAGATSFK